MSDMLRVVYIARHGEIVWSLTGQQTGRTDLALTEHGEAVARSLANRLKGSAFTSVFVGPLQRAQRTYELAGFGSAAVIDPDLVEWDYGLYEGRTVLQRTFEETARAGSFSMTAAQEAKLRTTSPLAPIELLGAFGRLRAILSSSRAVISSGFSPINFLRRKGAFKQRA